mmetsp:Transcript_40998/g.94545  ORF Transcript_40998/g.94545 Transcript_40998/m.94545 type:complete len:81 (-) Transcript_40998:26-268(-)
MWADVAASVAHACAHTGQLPLAEKRLRHPHHAPHNRAAATSRDSPTSTHHRKVDLAKTYSKPKKKSCSGCSSALPDSFNG